MYIWRGKNRRDRRNLLLSASFLWGPPKNEYNTDAEDDLLRHEGEAVHCGYFHDRIRVVMHEYLSTANGKIEVERLIVYLEEAAKRIAIQEAEDEAERLKREGGQLTRKGVNRDEVIVVPAEMKKKKNIYEIFRKYDADGSNSIDQGELRILLDELKVPMTDEELDELFDELDEDGGGDIGFEEFYNWFVREADKQRDKNSKGVAGFLRRVNPVKSDVFDGFKRLVMEVEARNLSMDHAVWKATRDARVEYRKAHPPRFACADPHCGAAFPTKALLDSHTADIADHELKDKERAELHHRFKVMEAVLAGPHGRNILANRLLYSIELGSTETRIAAAKETPFRPRLNDPAAKRKNQLLAGMLVQGHDPKAGIRPGFRQWKLVNQHRAPGRKEDQPMLQDILANLLHCRDETIDIVSAPVCSSHAQVLFVWKGFAVKSVCLTGEFNGWRPEEMTPNPKTGNPGLVKNLGPGKYRYRYVIDGEDRLDETASTIDDGPEQFKGTGLHAKRFGMGGISNIILVINPMMEIKKAPLKPQIGPDALLSSRSSSTIATKNTYSSSYTPASLSPGARDFPTSKSKGGGPNSPHSLVPLDENPTGGTMLEQSQIVRASSYSDNPHCILLPPRHMDSHELGDMTKINLRNMSLYDDGAWAFSAFLQRNSLIKHIDLSSNNISDEGLEAIAAALPSLLKLECIKLNGNNGGVDGCRYLVKNLKQKPSLLRVEMCSNNIGDDGAEVLAEGLILRNPSLLELFLDSCFIGNDGIGSISFALLHNKVLHTLSLAQNRVYTEGCRKLSTVLAQNATLTSINLAGNPLGADGVKIIGDSLQENDTLVRLDLSSTDMIRGRSGEGINALLFMLRVNHSLRYLSLRNNGLGQAPMHLLPIDIAYALTFNKGLTELDLDGNPMDAKWLLPDKFITTHILKEMPSIRTSIDRIKKLYANPESAVRFNKTLKKGKREVDPSPDGYWTNRRKWKKVNRRAEERRALQLHGSQEEIRITLEKEHVDDTVERHLLSLGAFLDNPNCRSFVRTLAKMVRTHVKNLVKLAPPVVVEEEADDVSINTKGSKATQGSKAMQNALALNASSENTAMEAAAQAALAGLGGIDDLDDDDDEKGDGKEEVEETKSEKVRKKAAKKEADRLAKLIPFDNAHFNFIHAAVGKSVYSKLHCDKRHLTILAEKIREAFFLMGLPLTPSDIQEATVAIQIPNHPLLSFKKFLEYVKVHADRLVKLHPFSRRRIELDLHFNLPISEAKRIILDHAEFIARKEIRKEYRAQKGYEPMFWCHLCHERFHSLKSLERHQAKGVNSPDHLKLLQLDEVHSAQSYMLRHAKFLVTGTYFPCFYELHPDLPEGYIPQVLDSMGDEGRPIGVIEPNTTVLVEDVLGDFLQISFEGQLGWVRYRLETGRLAGKSTRRILRVACQEVPNFSWEKLQVNSKPMYYQVRDDPSLPKRLELKVRMLPVLSGEPCGYLKLGEVVESKASFGDWLQIRFRNNDAAWVVKIVGGGMHKPAPPPVDEAVVIEEITRKAREARQKLKEELASMSAAARRHKRLEIKKKGGLAYLTREEEQEEIAAGLAGAEMFRVLHPSVQHRLSLAMPHSPYVASPEDLVVDRDWKLVEIGAELDEIEDEEVGPADDASEASKISKGSKGSKDSKKKKNGKDAEMLEDIREEEKESP